MEYTRNQRCHENHISESLPDTAEANERDAPYLQCTRPIPRYLQLCAAYRPYKKASRRISPGTSPAYQQQPSSHQQQPFPTLYALSVQEGEPQIVHTST